MAGGSRHAVPIWRCPAHGLQPVSAALQHRRLVRLEAASLQPAV